jgi:cell division protein FtsW
MTGSGAAVRVRERWRMGVEARALVIASAALLAFGLAVLYSASQFLAVREQRFSSAYYMILQMSGALIGIVAFALAAKTDAERWRAWAWPLLFASIVLLLIPVLPGLNFIAPRINGSRRWIRIGIAFQPSEFAKLAVIVWTAMLIVKKGDALRRFTTGLLPFLLVLAVLSLLVILEPDLSMVMTFTLLMGVVLFTGGVRLGHGLLLAGLALPLIWKLVERVQYALQRLTSYLDQGSAPAEASYQLKQSLIAIGSGGWFGVGFGQGKQQTGFLPFPYNDFIGSNIGEEWGFVGLLGVTLLFVLYGWLGFRIAKLARTPFQQLLATGLTFSTVSTAFLHLGVVTGLLPTTGLTLPFVSYGRTNLILTIVMTGILVNIGSTRERVAMRPATDPMSMRRA